MDALVGATGRRDTPDWARSGNLKRISSAKLPGSSLGGSAGVQ
jgi:hypothetical protein